MKNATSVDGQHAWTAQIDSIVTQDLALPNPAPRLPYLVPRRQSIKVTSLSLTLYLSFSFSLPLVLVSLLLLFICSSLGILVVASTLYSRFSIRGKYQERLSHGRSQRDISGQSQIFESREQQSSAARS